MFEVRDRVDPPLRAMSTENAQSSAPLEPLVGPWLAMETAPKNRRLIFLYRDGLIVCGQWSAGPGLKDADGFYSDEYPAFFGNRNWIYAWHRRGPSNPPIGWQDGDSGN